VARHVRAVSRSVALLFVLAAMGAEAALLFLCGRLRTSGNGARWVHRWCPRILACMGVQSSVRGPLPGAAAASGEQFEAIVANHLSYLDILLLSSALPSVFVAKDEVSRWPFIGWLTTRAGAVYVYRGGRRETYPLVNARMANAFRSGVPVVFFPEGTTANGTEVLPFRRGLFHSVLRDRVAVRTAAIEYELIGGDGSVAEDVCWCGDADLVPHLYRLLGFEQVRATVTFGATACGQDRFELAEDARRSVMELAGHATEVLV
jgi:1-acyl-sn-glycerol-3-phosphate acyltransferase